MIDVSLLAVGALAAVGGAFWRQLGTVAKYATSFAIARASFDGGVSNVVYFHLRKEWSPLPGVQSLFAGRYLFVRGKSSSSLVPFRLTPYGAIYRKGWTFIMTGGSDRYHMTITTICGTVNFENLIANAVTGWHRHTQGYYEDSGGENAKIDRYAVFNVYGRDKTEPVSINQAGHLIAGTTEDETSSKPNWPEVIYALDKSFMYQEEGYDLTPALSDPFSSLYYDAAIMDHVAAAEQWLNMGSWYRERGIPWKMGMNFYGKPGTGKSSMAGAIARKLMIPVYRFHLSTLSDQEFLKFWSEMDAPCMALLEDLDTVMAGKTRDSGNHGVDGILNMATVLNAISGVNSPDGVLLIITTNYQENLDTAFGVSSDIEGVSTRPGRVDVAVEFGPINTLNMERMAKSILRDWPDEWAPAIARAGNNATPAQFQEILLQAAYRRIRETRYTGSPATKPLGLLS